MADPAAASAGACRRVATRAADSAARLVEHEIGAKRVAQVGEVLMVGAVEDVAKNHLHAPRLPGDAGLEVHDRPPWGR